MKRIVLKHLSGSKANQVEEFPLNHFEELVIGRDPSATVKFDPDKDDLVGRQHAKILRDGPDSSQFLIKDLGSRNGTYLNKERIIGTANIVPGDIVQFGPGGPEFQFDLEPRPENLVRPTRIAAGPGSESPTAFKNTPPQTRVADSLSSASASAAGSNGGKSGVGKTTVMRMVSQSKSESRRNVIIAASVLLLLVAVGIAGSVWWTHRKAAELAEQQRRDQENADQQIGGIKDSTGKAIERAAVMTPAEIAQQYNKATVYIEMAWKLINTRTGKQVFQQKVPNVYTDEHGQQHELVPRGPKSLAAFLLVGPNTLEPAFGDDPASGIPIGGAGTGTGFVITSDGFILTNRHVAATWRIPYETWGKGTLPAIIIDPKTGGPVLDQQGQPVVLTDPRQLPQGWIPADSKQVPLKGKFIGSTDLEGKNDYLNVTFPGNELRNQATLKRVSDRHDVALIKVDIPEPLPKVEINDNYDTIKQGDAVVVLGYPGGAYQQLVVVGSKAPMDEPERLAGIIPNPTLSAGYVGKVLRGQEGPGKDVVVSLGGDIYQLTINTTGGGNSGGPVFDEHGRVIAIYTYGRQTDFQISGAVPIRYAKELMGIAPVNN